MNSKIQAYDECLRLIDRMIREKGKTNIFYADEINSLRNQIVELQEAEEKEVDETLENIKKNIIGRKKYDK